MNTVRAYPWLLAGWLLSGMAYAAVDKQLPDSVFEDWSGLVRKIDLNDQSVLFEYTSRSYSGSTSGATVAISFIPRFSCGATVNVGLPGEARDAVESPQLEFTFGREQLTFAGLVDYDFTNNTVVYSVAALAPEMHALRNLIDRSSRVKVRVFSGSDNSSGRARRGSELAFSLIGSRLSTLAIEQHCLTHKPIAYDPQ